jgi:hypothetical protein
VNGQRARQYGLTVDPQKLKKKIKAVKDHRERHDLVERCNIFELPLTVSPKTREDIFYAALGELCACYGTDSSATRNLIRPFLERGAASSFRDSDGNYDFAARTQYPPHVVDAIIAMAYPWFSRTLFMSLLRVNLEARLDVRPYRDFAGQYRYFRAYPLTDDTFVLRDGRLKVEVDDTNNIIGFGHVSQNWQGGDFEKGQYEHRGFVVPGRHKTDLISFRGSITRFASIGGRLDDESEGAIITHTRGRHKKPPRPFVAQFLLFKKGHEFERLLIPTVEREGEIVFDETSDEYKQIFDRFAGLSRRTVSSDFGFMWGTSPETARKASEDQF